MSFDPTAGPARLLHLPPLDARPEPRRAASAERGEFAAVLELEAARRQRMTGPDRIPEEVWADVARAAEIAEDLASRGQRVRFSSHLLSGRIAADLCDGHGNVVRRMSLSEVVDPDPRPPSAA